VLVRSAQPGLHYRVIVVGTPPAPTLVVSAPAAGQTLIANPQTTLAGTVSGVRSGSVTLAYTTVPTTTLHGHRSPNYAGTTISRTVPIHEGHWSYRWDAGTLPPGTYYVYATLNNGSGPLVSVYGAGAVRVVQPAHPAAPRDVTAVQRGSTLTLLWAPPVRAGIVAGYRIRWRTRNMPKGRSYVLNLGNVQRFNLQETRPAAGYTATVSAVDVLGHESLAVPARLVPVSAGKQMAPRASDFRFSAGRVSAFAGQYPAIPLSLHPLGRATHGPADFVTLRVSGLPTGAIATLSATTVDLFAQPAGTAGPAIRVLLPSALKPGTYRVRVTAQQGVTGRTRTAVVTLLVQRSHTGAYDARSSAVAPGAALP
jgi:hypothetical protein